MISAVYRQPLIGPINESFSLAGIAKVGAGVMLPHTSDVVLGKPNDVGSKTLANAIGLNRGWWQLNGWTVGAEVGVRAVLLQPFYVELSDKLAYADLLDLPAYRGKLRQSLVMNEIVLSLGYTFNAPF